jgi:hypothetical protein
MVNTCWSWCRQDPSGVEVHQRSGGASRGGGGSPGQCHDRGHPGHHGGRSLGAHQVGPAVVPAQVHPIQGPRGVAQRRHGVSADLGGTRRSERSERVSGLGRRARQVVSPDGDLESDRVHPAEPGHAAASLRPDGDSHLHAPDVRTGGHGGGPGPDQGLHGPLAHPGEPHPSGRAVHGDPGPEVGRHPDGPAGTGRHHHPPQGRRPLGARGLRETWISHSPDPRA